MTQVYKRRDWVLFEYVLTVRGGNGICFCLERGEEEQWRGSSDNCEVKKEERETDCKGRWGIYKS